MKNGYVIVALQLLSALFAATTPSAIIAAVAAGGMTGFGTVAVTIAIFGVAVIRGLSGRLLAVSSSADTPMPPCPPTAARVALGIAATAACLLSWSAFEPQWALAISGSTAFCVILLRSIGRSLDEATIRHNQTLAALADAERDASKRAAAEVAATNLARMIGDNNLAALTSDGTTVLRTHEIPHLALNLRYSRLIDGSWGTYTSGVFEPRLSDECGVLCTTHRLVVKTPEHGDLSFWWNGLTSMRHAGHSLELHYESGAPLYLTGNDIPLLHVYADTITNKAEVSLQ